MVFNLPACLALTFLASPIDCRSLKSLAVPSFLSAAVRIDSEFLDIASIGSASIGFSDPVIFILNGLLGNDPPAILGPCISASSIICL